MPRERECTICKRTFTSYNGKTVCSEECRVERKRLQDKEGNRRRYAGESCMLLEKICPICDKAFDGLREVYCSEECALEARKVQTKEAFRSWYYSGDNRDKVLKRQNNRMRK